MAVFQNTTAQYQASATAGQTHNVFAWTMSTIRKWKQANDTRTALSRLTDRELDDIGVSRHQIEAIAHR